MPTAINLDHLDESTRAFLQAHGAAEGQLSVKRVENDGRVGVELELWNQGGRLIDLTPDVRGHLLMAASRADGVTSTEYALSANTPKPGAGPKTLSRADFEALDPVAKAQAMRDRVTLRD